MTGRALATEWWRWWPEPYDVMTSTGRAARRPISGTGNYVMWL